MTKELLRLYRECYPGIVYSEREAERCLADPENHVILRREDGALIGALVLSGNSVLMFCVRPDRRRRGIGSGLLAEAEAYAHSQGFDELLLCEAGKYITPGAPLYDGNRQFFEKRGYVDTWGDTECVDMMMDLWDFHHTTRSLNETIDGVTYRWAELPERDEVVDCAGDALEEFAKYYRDETLYREDGNECVLVAERDGKICGALLVGVSEENPELGTVGCTSVRPACAGNGIATTMVQLGTKALKEAGLSRAFLSYTYSGIVPMYARSGYQVCMKYFMGKKRLSA